MFITEWIRWGGRAIVLIRTNGNLLEMISAGRLFLPVQGEIGERLQLYSMHDRAEASLSVQDSLVIVWVYCGLASEDVCF